jgi:predicted metal-dependent enzyme (double-stranded beta helix superfamily)
MDMTASAKHSREIDAAMRDIRAIEARTGVTREGLEAIQRRLMDLAARTDLFTLEDYPPPQPGDKSNSRLYRLHEDSDHRLALYANASRGMHASPVHNHTTWAVIVGITGEELNRLYERTPDGGVREVDRKVVRQGSGVAFMPEDLHSIHIDQPLLNFHLYGLGLEQLVHRQYYKPEARTWAVFGHHPDIREARASVAG